MSRVSEPNESADVVVWSEGSGFAQQIAAGPHRLRGDEPESVGSRVSDEACDLTQLNESARLHKSKRRSDCGAASYLRFSLVRNEEAGASNPLSTTNVFFSTS